MALKPLTVDSKIVVYNPEIELIDKTAYKNHQGVAISDIFSLVGTDQNDFVSNVVLNGTDLEFTGTNGAFSGAVDLSSIAPTDGLLVGTQYEFVSGNGTPAENGAELIAKYSAAKSKVQETVTSAGNISVTGSTFTRWSEPVTVTVGGDPILFLKYGANRAYYILCDIGTSREYLKIYVTNIDQGNNEFTFILLDERDPVFPNMAVVNTIERLESTVIPSTLLVAPGEYYIGEVSFDAAVNIIAIDGETSVTMQGISIFNHVVTSDYNITIAGLKFNAQAEGDAIGSMITPTTNIGYIFKNVYSNQTYAFNAHGKVLGGEYINCTGGDNSFGFDCYDVIGTFKNCTAGEFSFAVAGPNATPVVEDCKATRSSFGEAIRTLSGVFKNCGAIDPDSKVATTSDSFGNHNSLCTALFINCYGHNNVFGFETEDNKATYIDCTATGDSTFGAHNAYANFFARNCIAWGDSAFAFRPAVRSTAGSIIGCEARGAQAFGFENGSGATFQNYQGKIYNSVAKGSAAFNDGASIDAVIIGCISESSAISSVNNGMVRNCVDSNFNVVNIP